MTIAQVETEARGLVDADATSYPAPLLLLRENNAYEQIVGELIALDTNWNFGDSNLTTLPTGLVTLTNSNEVYQLAGNSTSTGVSTTTPLLTFLGASVKTVGGLWQTLQPITLWELYDRGYDPVEFFKTDGLPLYYELREDFLVLYPAPDNGVSVTLSSGLKVFYQRTASVFTSAEVTTGTKVPGFASPYHSLMSYKAALPYALSFKKDRVPMILAEIQRLERGLIEFYSKRNKAERNQITMAPINFR